ncbi:MAG: hypothetical protein QXS37_02230 [Candidatus Aenigmatarchaeota archaeon]
MPEELSLAEKMIYNIAGEKGVDLYRIADGKTTIENAAKLLKISESEVEELLRKLEKFIKIEVEAEEKKEEKITTIKKEVEPIFIPKRIANLSIIDISQLTIEFGPTGKRIYESLNNKDVVELSIENNISLDVIDKILIWLTDKKVLKFHILDEKEIKKRYGEAGLQIYEKYGRKGIFIYLLLEKYGNPIDAIKNSYIENSIEILEFIYKVLSIQFDREKIERIFERELK